MFLGCLKQTHTECNQNDWTLTIHPNVKRGSSVCALKLAVKRALLRGLRLSGLKPLNHKGLTCIRRSNYLHFRVGEKMNLCRCTPSDAGRIKISRSLCAKPMRVSDAQPTTGLGGWGGVGGGMGVLGG